MTEAGVRVGAILSADDKEVLLLGYGVYVGDEVPPGPPAFFGMKTWEELDAYYEENYPQEVADFKEGGGWPLRPTNPKIELDDGDVVWGQECWWGDEECVKREIENHRALGHTVKVVSIGDYR